MEKSLSQKSYEYIRKKVTSGGMAPGKRLVNRTLADEIGVSVIPVREAIHRLASEGVVDHIPGAGAFVPNPNRQDLDSLYALRDALESCAAAEAARYITDEQLDEIQHVIQRAEKTADQIGRQSKRHANRKQFERWLDDEQHFHELLIESSRNKLLAKVVDEHRAIGSVFAAQRNDPRILTYEVAIETCKSKSALLHALRNRDAELARRLTSEQIQRGRKKVMAFLRKKSNRTFA